MALSSTFTSGEGEMSVGIKLYRRIWLLVLSTVVLCAALIYAWGSEFGGGFFSGAQSALDLGVRTLFPYMISAVIAAVTAIAVLALLPMARSASPVARLVQRVNELSAGDLSTRVNIHGDGSLKILAGALNQAVTALGAHVSSLKVVNRQQWSTLCLIRASLESNQPQQALKYVSEMEKNWEKMAAIEKQLVT